MSKIQKIYNRILWALEWVQFKPMTLDRKKWVNVKSAKNTIDLCEEIGITPSALFDVGANDGQWAYWLKQRWPMLAVESFEPNQLKLPIGTHHKIALSKRSGAGNLLGRDTSAFVSECVGGNVPLERFDSYWKHPIPRHSILKIDAETKSADALVGFGNKINSFSLVIIEVCWDNCRTISELKGQAKPIFEFMLKNGFSKMTVVDDAIYSGRSDFADFAFWK